MHNSCHFSKLLSWLCATSDSAICNCQKTKNEETMGVVICRKQWSVRDLFPFAKWDRNLAATLWINSENCSKDQGITSYRIWVGGVLDHCNNQIMWGGMRFYYLYLTYVTSDDINHKIVCIFKIFGLLLLVFCLLLSVRIHLISTNEYVLPIMSLSIILSYAK